MYCASFTYTVCLRVFVFIEPMLSVATRQDFALRKSKDLRKEDLCPHSSGISQPVYSSPDNWGRCRSLEMPFLK